MSMKRILAAGILGAALATTALTPTFGETLRVMQGAASGALNVPLNRAVVVESDVPFAELSIANPGIADISTLSDKTIYVLGKAPGRTTLTLLAPDGTLISNVDVQVTPDVAEFKERLRQILPGEHIEVRTANDGIVLSGNVSSIGKLERALDLANRYAPDRVSNLMSVAGTQQVMLKVRFAEISRSVSKQLNGRVSLIAAGTDGIVTAGLGSANVVGGGGDLGVSAGIGSLQFSVLLEALESKGLARTLAEPNLTALSGQEARFLAGGEYPVPAPDGSGGTQITYKTFGVDMIFTPTVVDGDLINIKLATNVSSLDPNTFVVIDGANVNAFKTRLTTTTVEMRDGESFAIAGLLQDDFRDLNGQVPWLGDVPVLGALFRSADYQRAQSELVIIITPHLVTPTRGEALALPTDRIRLPSERELFLFGKVAGKANTPEGEVARQDFNGAYGYVME
jgi:pilus assembly protein CpaC